jgi:uncharacterized RDD family membrane protein YckC
MVTTPQAYPGQRLGLPSAGPGSLASTGPRVIAFAVDCVASGMVAGLFVGLLGGGSGTDPARHLPGNWSLVAFAADYIVGLALGGRTLGMYLAGLRVVRVDRPVGTGRPAPVTVLSAAIRTVLLALLVPALIWDRDRRGLHDRLTNTAVVRATVGRG